MKWFVILTVVSLLSGCGSKDIQYSHRFSKGYDVLYPPGEALFYHHVQVTDTFSEDTATFLFYFMNTFPDFKNYRFRQDSFAAYNSEDGMFKVKFNRHVTVDTYSAISVDVFTDDNKSKKFEMLLSFDPKIVQERNGRTGIKDGLFIRNGEVGYMEVLPENFINTSLTSDERKYFEEEFAAGLINARSVHQKVNILAKKVLQLVESARGIPGNNMDTLSAADQLRSLKSNKVYCGNIANIFKSVCLAFDIPARNIALGNDFNTASDPEIYHSDFHSTVEVFDKETGAWYFTDLSFYILGAGTGQGTVLNFVDFFYMLHSPGEMEKIWIKQYDVEKDKEIKVKLSESKYFDKLMDYYKKNQKFYFPHKNGFYSY